MITSLKTCFKCRASKPLTEFYAHKQMADGHLNKCKECTKFDVRVDYKSDPEKHRERNRERAKTPERRAKAIEYQRARRIANPMKTKARNAVSNALRDGKLKRLPCEVCGNHKSQAHHGDYRYPLAVRWLCFTHHRGLAHNQAVTAIAA